MPRPHYNILIVDDSPHDRATCKRYLLRDPDRIPDLHREFVARVQTDTRPDDAHAKRRAARVIYDRLSAHNRWHHRQ
jgi:hypothetical protein